MPINRHHFDLGVVGEGESWMREIYDYLAGHQDSAYSYQELLSAIPLRLRPKGIKVDKTNFDRALDALVWIGAVDTRKIDDTPYYASLKEFNTRSWEPKVGV